MDERRIRDELTAQRDPSLPLDGHGLLRRARRRGRARGAAVGATLALALVVGAALFWGPDEDEGRLAMRGADAEPVSLELAWLVEGTSLARGGTSPVAASEQVVFVARTSRDAWLCLDEKQGEQWRRVVPQEGRAWSGVAGENLVERDGTPQAFRTDLGPGPREYRLQLDPEFVDCRAAVAVDTVTIQWLP